MTSNEILLYNAVTVLFHAFINASLFNNTTNNGNDTYVGTEWMWSSKLLKKLGMNMFETENSLQSLKAFFLLFI